MTLKRKLEVALTAYLTDAIDDADLGIYAGHDRAPEDEDGISEVVFPALIVYAENSLPFEDMPTSLGVRSVSMRMEIMVDSTSGDDDDRDRIDAWRDQIDEAMGDVAAVQAALNPPATGSDERAIVDLHVYDVIPTGEPSDVKETEWVEQFTYEVIATNGDALTE
jgi:hypothetical protein